MTMQETERLTAEQRELVSKNLDLAHHLASVAWRKYPGRDRVDNDYFVSEAYEGLIKAAQRFDPSRANVVDGQADLRGAFSGFARQYINGAIMENQRSLDHVPKRTRRSYKELQGHGHGRGRSVPELSDLTGLEENKIRLIVAAVEQMPASLDAENEQGPLMDRTADSGMGSATETTVLVNKIQEAFIAQWETLPEIQQVVIAMRYYEGLSLAAISEILEIRVALVRAEHTEALDVLHSAMIREAS